MTLFFSLLPLYLFGNLHCLGMCGPLVALFHRHPHRNLYLFGRLFAFTAVGALSGASGAVLTMLLSRLYLGGVAAWLCALLALAIGWQAAFSMARAPADSQPNRSAKRESLLRNLWKISLRTLQKKLAALSLSSTPLSMLILGSSSVLLPCGQSLLVFSACALSGSGWIGALNGFAFSLLTSPALFLVLQRDHWLLARRQLWQRWEKPLILFSSGAVALFAFLRGAAEFGWVDHGVIALWGTHLVLW